MHAISSFIINLISNMGYWGIYIGMFIESASIPLPSEIIMGFAGYLVYKGQFNLFTAALVGALGNISGSTSMYLLGITGGRKVVKKYGKYFHFNNKKLAKAEKMFAKWGDKAVFISQLLPGVRTFISLPAGILKVNFPKFIVYTFVGALIWCYLLALLALKLGENWHIISNYIHEIELVMVIIVILAILYIFRNKFINIFNFAKKKI